MTEERLDATMSDAVAARVRALRKSRGWPTAALAARCRELGDSQLTGNVIENIESGRRRDGERTRAVTVDELLVLAVALDVAPVHLMVPPLPSPLWGGDGVSRSPDDPNIPNDDEPCPVTPAGQVPCWRARQFIRGQRPLPGMDPWKFYAEAPPHERLPERELGRTIQIEQDGGPAADGPR